MAVARKSDSGFNANGQRIISVGAPTANSDALRLADTLAVFTGPSNYWQLPSNGSGGVATALGGANTASGYMSLVPFDVVGASRSYKAIGVGCTTAQSGGTVTNSVAIYPSDADDFPLLSGGPIASGTVTLTATGNRSATITVTLPPGRYWLAFLYVATVAPTTAAQIYCLNTAMMLAHPNAFTIGTGIRGYTASGLSALPTNTQPTLTAAANGVAIVALQTA